METTKSKQYGTKMEKDRAKKAYQEKRTKFIMAQRKKDKKENPISSKLMGGLNKLSGTGTKEGVSKRLGEQFEHVYKKEYGKGDKKRSGKDRLNSYVANAKPKKDGTIKKGMVKGYMGGGSVSRKLAKKYFKGGIV